MKLICIVGPTGVGKTKLSIALAHKFKGEVINADSTQVFKGLDIATAKIKEEEKDGIPHHLFDIKEVNENYTVYDYQKGARYCIDDILKRGKTPILVGGTGLYIKAALYDYKFDVIDKKHDFSSLSNEEVYLKLKELDPNTDIHINNRKRVERALAYSLDNNISFSNKEKTDKLLYDVIFIGLTTKRDILYDKINKRVDCMIESGLVDEAKDLYNKNINSKAVMTPIGYKELFLYFENKMNFSDSIDLIKQRSRRYAKRQYTWFNNQMNINWFDVDYENFDNTINDVVKYIENNM